MTAAVLVLPSHSETPAGLSTSHEVASAAGVTYRQLDSWVRCDLIHPAISAPGSGYVRCFDRTERAVVCLAAALVREGLSPAPAVEHARRLLEHGSTVLAGITLHLPEEP